MKFTSILGLPRRRRTSSSSLSLSRLRRGPTGASDPDILRFWPDCTAGACNRAIYPLKQTVILCPTPEATKADQLIKHRYIKSPAWVVWHGYPPWPCFQLKSVLCRSAGNVNESPASGLTSERLLRTQCRAGYCQCCTQCIDHLSIYHDRTRAKSARLPVPLVVR